MDGRDGEGRGKVGRCMGAKSGVVCGMGKVGTIVKTYHLLTTSVPFLMLGSKRPLTPWGV